MTVHRGRSGLQAMLAALGEPTRRAAYDFVRRAGRPVTRSEVAEELGIAVRLAAFHLDRLAEEGVVTTDYARPPGRRGPGAGRPAKRYAPSPARFEVSLPPRRYDVAARILLAGMGTGDPAPFLEAGRRYGEQLVQDHPDEDLRELLIELGYEPEDVGDTIELVNCPFHELAEVARTETCTLNHAFLQGLVSRCAPDRLAELAPRGGYCCVRVPLAPRRS